MFTASHIQPGRTDRSPTHRWSLAASPLLLVVALLTLSGAGCRHRGERPDPGTAAGGAREYQGTYPIRVVCTTGPVADLVRQVGGAQLQVEALMGPGVDPHLYRAVPSDIARLERADLVVYNGLHLEGRIIELLEHLGKTRQVVAVTSDRVAANDARLRSPPQFSGHYDPHVWHDAMLWCDCARDFSQQLARFDPTHEAAYRAGADAYCQELQEADKYARQAVESIPPPLRVLVSAHDAFYYFGQAYGLDNEPLRGVSTEDEIDMARIDAVIAFLVARKIPAIFVETAVAPKVVESLIEPCRARGQEVRIGGELYADALGAPGSNAETVPLMLRANAATIASALGGGDSPQ